LLRPAQPITHYSYGSAILAVSGSALIELELVNQALRPLTGLCHLAEISYDHTQEDFCMEIGTGSRISPPGGVVSNAISGHISATDQDIFIKFGV